MRLMVRRGVIGASNKALMLPSVRNEARNKVKSVQVVRYYIDSCLRTYYAG